MRTRRPGCQTRCPDPASCPLPHSTSTPASHKALTCLTLSLSAGASDAISIAWEFDRSCYAPVSCDGEEVRVRAPPSCSTTSPPPPADPPHTQPQPFADLSRIARAHPPPPPIPTLAAPRHARHAPLQRHRTPPATLPTPPRRHRRSRPSPHVRPWRRRCHRGSARAPPPPPHPATPVPLLSPLMTCVLSVCSPSRRPVPSSPSSPSPPDAAHSLTVVSPHGCRRRVRWRLRERALPGHLPSPT